MKIQKKDIRRIVTDNNIQQISLLFSDMYGVPRVKYVGVNEILGNSHVSWYDGMSIDGTQIPSLKGIPGSGWLVIVPDKVGFVSGKREGIRDYSTLDIICDFKDNPYGPRNIVKTVSQWYAKEGLRVNMGPKLRFYTDLSVPSTPGEFLDMSREINPGFRFLVVDQLNISGIDVEYHSCPAPNQIDLDFIPKELVAMADNIFFSKNLIQRLALDEKVDTSFITSYGRNFSPNFMQTHQSVWDGTKTKVSEWKNLFFDPNDKYELSDLGRQYIAGILTYLDAIIPVTLPNYNAFKSYLSTEDSTVGWSVKRDSNIITVPMYFEEKKKRDRVGWSKRILFKPVSSQSNPYLSFAMMAASGFFGIKERMEFQSDNVSLEKDYALVMQRFRDSPFARKILGNPVVDILYSRNMHEYESIMKEVTDEERNLYR